MSGVFPAVVWRLTLVDLLLLLAPLVIVPLGLRLVPFIGPQSLQVLKVARVVQPLGAVAAVVSFLISPGWTASGVSPSIRHAGDTTLISAARRWR